MERPRQIPSIRRKASPSYSLRKRKPARSQQPRPRCSRLYRENPPGSAARLVPWMSPLPSGPSPDVAPKSFRARGRRWPRRAIAPAARKARGLKAIDATKRLAPPSLERTSIGPASVSNGRGNGTTSPFRSRNPLPCALSATLNSSPFPRRFRRRKTRRSYATCAGSLPKPRRPISRAPSIEPRNPSPRRRTAGGRRTCRTSRKSPIGSPWSGAPSPSRPAARYRLPRLFTRR